jgi:hypothetical protein
MDDWDDRYLAQCQFLFSKIVFKKIGERCRTEYLEGTAVARGSYGVPGGYCRGIGVGHV